jgi:RNA polymerase sigma-70 factor (ECF subfamily)
MRLRTTHDPGDVRGEAAFDDLFRTEFGPLVRSLTVAAGDQELARDCVADAFERAFVRWRRISRYENPAAWVRRVALNRLRDDHRRGERRRRALDRLAGEPTPAVSVDAPDELARVLGALPRQPRIAAALFYVHDLPVNEVAAAMGLSAGAVKFHLNAARQRLRDVLGSEVDCNGR